MGAILLGLFVFSRISGLLLSLPLFNTAGVPKYVLVLSAVGLTLVLAPLVPMIEQPSSFGMLIVSIASEVLLGLLMGTVVSVLFGAIALGTEIMAQQAGLGMAAVFNPMIKVSSGALGTLATFLAGMVFLSGGVHLYCLKVVAASFSVLPAGVLYNPLNAGPVLLHAVSESIALGAQLAGPVLGLVWCTNLFVGILVRLAPRMNIYFSVGTILTSVAALSLFALSLPVLLQTHADKVREAAGWLTGLLQILGSSSG